MKFGVRFWLIILLVGLAFIYTYFNNHATYQHQASQLEFARPALELVDNQDGSVSLYWSANQPDLVNFQGRIRFYRQWVDYRFVDPFDGGSGFFYDITHNSWRYLGSNNQERGIESFLIGKTTDGNPIYRFRSGDAGGLSQYFVVPVGHYNDQQAVVEFQLFTQESLGEAEPSTEIRTARAEQHRWLEDQFLSMAQSARLMPTAQK